ncbi:AraC family transcriptional regulator [Tunturibacter empetritectus]|uniref:AraC-like DNA-binding protein n=2 Tax=Tunturiibacter TaxID=3154218 RepID=A0A7W8J834_9BACT|nr:AraC family transcriptional regulator [Edaphobacter lichenicola]MBB5317972.1 AraC-like DNA-binding protein [Edaphobacter lichenicola]MBB5343047.1 AraC-like DNA-binding protein [Edaphobacter lichenicola]
MSKRFRIPGRLATRLHELGVGASAVLQSAGLAPGLLDQPRIVVTTEELFALWRGVGVNSPNPAIGLELGTETKAEHFDPIALAALSTASFGEAMEQMARYKQLSCPEEIIHEMDDSEWSIQFRWLLADSVEPAVLTDLCFAWVLCIARHGTGTRISPLRLELARQPTHAKIFERHFGCPIVFGAVRNAIIFRSSDAALPFVTSNAELLAMLAPQFDEELKQHKGEESFPERVRAAIQRKLAGRRPKMQEIARELHISSRTLQRRLQDAGYSFQQVLEEARHQLARHYLNNSLLELNETAYLLGYEDSNSFVRAFRMWEGTPPAHWRGAQREKVLPDGRPARAAVTS